MGLLIGILLYIAGHRGRDSLVPYCDRQGQWWTSKQLGTETIDLLSSKLHCMRQSWSSGCMMYNGMYDTN